jgi:hypothetical protein
MIIVHCEPYLDFNADFIEGETISELVARICQEAAVHVKAGWQMQETQTGKVLSPTDPVVDERLYFWNAWLERAA